MGKYADDIRRIAKTQELYDQVGALSSTVRQAINAADIGAQRGIAYFDPLSYNVASAQTKPPLNPILQKTVDNVVKGATDALKKALEQNNQTEAEADKNKDLFTVSPGSGSGIFNVKDIIDGAVDAANSALAAINGLTDMTDPYYNEPFSLRFNNRVEPPLGADTYDTITGARKGLGSDNDGATYTARYMDDTLDASFSGFQLGYYWDEAGYKGATPAQAISQYVASTRAGLFPNSFWDVASLTVTAGGATPTQYSYDWYEFVGATATNRNILRQTCLGGETYCPAVAPTPTGFPTSYEAQLYKDFDGLMKSSTLDLTNIGKAYRDGVSTLVFKFDSGTRYGIIEPTADGNWMIYEASSAGEAISDIRVYNQGKYTYIDGKPIILEQRTLKGIYSELDIQKLRPALAGRTFVKMTGLRIK